MESKEELSDYIFPYVKVYKDGRIERLAGTDIAPPGLDHETDVISKDTIIVSQTGVSVPARLYLPNSTESHKQLPLVIYYHGGGFFLSSIADPNYHHSLNKLVAMAKILLISVDYRLAPENPLPAAYQDSWAALEWVASNANNENWVRDYADFEQVFLAGDSCGANMAHHFGLRINKEHDRQLGLRIRGIAMIHPYFWGKDPIGVERIDRARKLMVDKWWLFVCPSDKGCDDPMINPFVDGEAKLEGLGCEKVVVIVSEKDILRDRGRLYYQNLVKSGWKGQSQIFETQGEDHVFHIFDPNSEKAITLFKLLASFFNTE